MTTTTFFIIFIPILAILLLAINLILAPHNPYQEKDSAFECGFHSFLGQNRTQFSISFFIFGLLFLLFDLEILLVYPFSVSSYTNDIYGLAVMMVFFVLLTLGFVFELGKNALTIESRQTSNNEKLPRQLAFIFDYLTRSGCSLCCPRCSTFIGALMPTNCHWCGWLSKNHELSKAGFEKNPETAHLFDTDGKKPALPTPEPCPRCIRGKSTGNDSNNPGSGGNGGGNSAGDNVTSVDTTTKNLLPILTFSVAFELPILEIIISSIAVYLDIGFSYYLLVAQPLLQLYRLYKLPARIVKLYSFVLKVIDFIKNIGKLHRGLILYLIMGIFLCISWTEFSCDSSKVWEEYFNHAYYHNGLALFIWVAFIVVAIHYRKVTKNYLSNSMVLVYKILLANLSISAFLLLCYMLYLLLVFLYTLQHVLAEYTIDPFDKDHCILGETSLKSTTDSQAWKELMFLASKGDNSSGNTGESSFSTGSSGTVSPPTIQATISPPTNQPDRVWTPIPGGMKWYDQWGFLQISYWVNPEGRYCLFGPASEDWVYKPITPRTYIWEPVGGQGTNPVYYTTAFHGEQLNRANTINTAEGSLDFCEPKKSIHKWNTVDPWNLQRDNGSCFQCKSSISHRHYACDNCFRHICDRCDVKSNFSATMNFNDRINSYRRK